MKKIRDGEGRKKKLYTAALIRKQIYPIVSAEHLLFNLIVDRTYFYDNSDKELTNARLLDMAKRVVATPLEDIRISLFRPKEYEVDKEYCRLHGIAPNEMKNRVRKALKDQQIGECYDCGMSVKDNLQMMKAARSFLGEGICAVDLAGNEAAFPMENFTELFQKAKKLGLPFTIHAGECGRVENVIEAVKCGASRIGHGIALRGHADAMAMCKEKQIGIEMCPISNLQTKAVASKSEYPMREFLDAGLCVTINTDNRTVSNSSIQKEMEFVQKNYGITDEELVRMTENAVHAAFANDEVKAELVRRLKEV